MLPTHVLGVATGQLDHPRGEAGVGRVAREPGQPAARAVPLPTAPVAAGTGRPGRIHDHVAGFTAETVRAAQDLALHGDPGADAGTQREEERVVLAPRCAPFVFAPRGAGRVVVDRGGQTGGVAEPCGEIEPLDAGQVRPGVHHAVPVDQSGRAQPERAQVGAELTLRLFAQIGDQLDERVGEGFDPGVGGGHAFGAQNPETLVVGVRGGCGVEDDSEQLGAPEIEPAHKSSFVPRVHGRDATGPARISSPHGPGTTAADPTSPNCA